MEGPPTRKTAKAEHPNAAKLEKLKVFYQQAIANEGWRKYKNIDLRYKGQVVAEKR